MGSWCVQTPFFPPPPVLMTEIALMWQYEAYRYDVGNKWVGLWGFESALMLYKACTANMSSHRLRSLYCFEGFAECCGDLPTR